MSPDGESVVTGAGDETLRFWNIFSKSNTQKVSFYLICMCVYVCSMYIYISCTLEKYTNETGCVKRNTF